jgi:hypothetical protein
MTLRAAPWHRSGRPASRPRYVGPRVAHKRPIRHHRIRAGARRPAAPHAHLRGPACRAMPDSVLLRLRWRHGKGKGKGRGPAPPPAGACAAEAPATCSAPDTTMKKPFLASAKRKRLPVRLAPGVCPAGLRCRGPARILRDGGMQAQKTACGHFHGHTALLPHRHVGTVHLEHGSGVLLARTGHVHEDLQAYRGLARLAGRFLVNDAATGLRPVQVSGLQWCCGRPSESRFTTPPGEWSSSSVTALMPPVRVRQEVVVRHGKRVDPDERVHQTQMLRVEHVGPGAAVEVVQRHVHHRVHGAWGQGGGGGHVGGSFTGV